MKKKVHAQTLAIKQKGWELKEVLERWGRLHPWYYDQLKGNEFAQQRLADMIEGLPHKSEA